MAASIQIEILFPEIANLFGDMMNMKYLKKCLPDADFIETSLDDSPAFVSQDISMVYMGPMTEHQQEYAISKLKPYKDQLVEMIGKGTIFLLTGNAFEIFGSYILDENEKKIDALGIFPTYAKRDMFHRYNSLIYGKFEQIKLVGFKAQFSHSYGDNSKQYFYKVIRGCGLNPESRLEGIREHNFFGTYTVGPFLLLNPLFTKYMISLLGIQQPQLAFEKDIMAAYKKRLKEFENEKLKYE